MKELRTNKEAESKNFMSKLAVLNNENTELSVQLKNVNTVIHSKEDELSKLKKMVNDSKIDREKLQSQLGSYQKMEGELAESKLKNSQAEQRIKELESKLEESKRVHESELQKATETNVKSEMIINDLNQKLKSEMLKADNLSEDNCLYKLELSKMDSYKLKCEQLEKQLFEIQSENIKRTNEANYSRFNEAQLIEKYESEIKYLKTQIINLVILHFSLI
jgi:hypothetical protein